MLRVVILGTDAVLAARPATPVQLARACMRAGFHFVAPVSWGEELLAERCIQSLRSQSIDGSIVVYCPSVVEALLRENGRLPQCCVAVSPPVATARYVRAAFSPRLLHVTYAGSCPGATAPDVDASLEPSVLLNSFFEAGIVPEEQPNYFDETLPPDRARHVSLPGGVPDPAILFEKTGLELREAAPSTLQAVLPVPGLSERILIDLEVAVGCHCARDRFAAAQLEPPRVAWPVVSCTLAVDLNDERTSRLLPVLTPRADEPSDETVLAEPLSAPQTPVMRDNSLEVGVALREPWSVAAVRDGA